MGADDKSVVALWLPSGQRSVLPFGKQKLLIGNGVVAFIGGDPLAVVRLVRVLHVCLVVVLNHPLQHTPSDG